MTKMPSIQGIERQIYGIVVGVSTGGPSALETLLSGLSEPLPVPMLVVQHMPSSFTVMLAERLDRSCPARVVEASPGIVPQAGVVYVAPGGKHMAVVEDDSGPRIRITKGPVVNSCRPSVDVLFHSSAKVWGANQLGIVMTGIGQDGLEGCRSLASAGATIYVQDKQSSVVWGMPGAVVAAGLADDVLHLDSLGRAVEQRASHLSSLILGKSPPSRSRTGRSADPKPDMSTPMAAITEAGADIARRARAAVRIAHDRDRTAT